MSSAQWWHNLSMMPRSLYCRESSSQRKASGDVREDKGPGGQSLSLLASRRGGAWREILISCNLLLKITESRVKQDYRPKEAPWCLLWSVGLLRTQLQVYVWAFALLCPPRHGFACTCSPRHMGQAVWGPQGPLLPRPYSDS